MFPRVSQKIVAQTGTPEAAYIMSAFLLFICAATAMITKTPKSLREKAVILTELEPGKLYHGYFIYHPSYVSDSDDKIAVGGVGKSSGSMRLIPGLLGGRKENNR